MPKWICICEWVPQNGSPHNQKSTDRIFDHDARNMTKLRETVAKTCHRSSRRRRHVAKYFMCLNSYAFCVTQGTFGHSRHFWSKMTQSGFGDAIWVWWRKVRKKSFCVDGGTFGCLYLGTIVISTESFILRRRGHFWSCRPKVGLVTQSGFGNAKNIFGHPTQFASLDPN